MPGAKAKNMLLENELLNRGEKLVCWEGGGAMCKAPLYRKHDSGATNKSCRSVATRAGVAWTQVFNHAKGTKAVVAKYKGLLKLA